ncbi:DNA adenine methylase, partial [Ornithobacterium rhinotracheale]|uniref:DNA adenine methylase n=1 Tax=Ornithobacterium rhinotracheale TaxID=28251 RepID=UPI001FF5A7DB
YCVLNKTKQLCEKIENAQLNIDEWRKQKKIQLKKDEANLLDLGFSTFYLNRTNRSGIINAGVIGGVEQKDNYLMDCRFNKLELIKRIKLIAKYKKNIRLYNKDANELIDIIQEEANKDNIIFYFDPPYYLKASTLYMNHYEDKNHKLVSDKIKSIRNIKWIVSYDNVSEIKKLYSDCSTKEFSFKHTAYQSRVGKEVLFFSNNIIQPEIKDYDPLRFKKAKETLDIIYKKTV